MAAQVRVLRQRIRSAKGMKKITKAMELVATSRIAKAQARVAASLPYAQAITGVLTALASNASIDHPLLTPRPQVRRAGVLLITSDRGLAGGYSTNAIRTAESLDRAAARRRQGTGAVRDRSQGGRLLPIPEAADGGELDGLLGAADVRGRPHRG